MKQVTQEQVQLAATQSNILAIYNLSNEVEIANGMCWYKVANREAQQIRVKSNQSLQLNQICGIIAALSPRNKWYRNLIDAENLASCYDGTLASLLDFKCSTFSDNKLKAILIASMVSPTDAEVLSILGGNKVRSFYQNILNPEGKTDVTVDGHATCIVLGYRQVGISGTGMVYKQLVNLYSCEANLLNILPSQLQAITWLTYRRLHGIK